MMDGKPIQEALVSVFLLALIAVSGVAAVHNCIGCTPHEQNTVIKTGENGAAVVQYDLALVECQKEARKAPEAVRFDAYIACEKAVSKHYCEESIELRNTWSRCKAVMP